MDEGIDKPLDDDGSDRSKSHSDHDSSVHSAAYGDEEQEDEQELIEAEMARQKVLDVYVEDLSDQIVNSNIPDEQQQHPEPCDICKSEAQQMEQQRCGKAES